MRSRQGGEDRQYPRIDPADPEHVARYGLTGLAVAQAAQGD